jgi:hypothetical protein
MSIPLSPLVAKSPLRVLIVEDCDDDLLLLLHELDRGGYAVSHSRVETVDALKSALTEDWQLVVSDCSLPTMTAHDVLTTLKADRPDLPCIVISGTIAEEAAVDVLSGSARFRREGADGEASARDRARAPGIRGAAAAARS